MCLGAAHAARDGSAYSSWRLGFFLPHSSRRPWRRLAGAVGTAPRRRAGTTPLVVRWAWPRAAMGADRRPMARGLGARVLPRRPTARGPAGSRRGRHGPPAAGARPLLPAWARRPRRRRAAPVPAVPHGAWSMALASTARARALAARADPASAATDSARYVHGARCFTRLRGGARRRLKLAGSRPQPPATRAAPARAPPASLGARARQPDDTGPVVGTGVVAPATERARRCCPRP